MPTTTAITTMTTLTGPVTIPISARLASGEAVTLLVPESELRRLALRVVPAEAAAAEKPVEGYAALSAALKERGVTVAVSTLKEWVARGRLPRMKFGRQVRFYVSQVLARMERRGVL